MRGDLSVVRWTLRLLALTLLNDAAAAPGLGASAPAPNSTPVLISECSASLRVEPIPGKTPTAIGAGYLVGSNVYRVQITNKGAEPITLVEPGDGSDIGWRTPIVSWRVEDARGPVTPKSGGRCGNINPLHREEVFALRPGESRDFRFFPFVWLDQPGSYRLSLTYANRPDLEWRGILLGKHDDEAMRLLRHSTPCLVNSNTLHLRIPEHGGPPVKP